VKITYLSTLFCLQLQVWLAAVGIMMVGLSIAVSMGLCAAAGVIYGPVHSILPFLMLGRNQDQMYCQYCESFFFNFVVNFPDISRF